MTHPKMRLISYAISIAIFITMCCEITDGYRWDENPDDTQPDLDQYETNITQTQLAVVWNKRLSLYATLQLEMQTHQWLWRLVETSEQPPPKYKRKLKNSTRRLIRYMDEMRILDRYLVRVGAWDNDTVAADIYLLMLEIGVNYPSVKSTMRNLELELTGIIPLKVNGTGAATGNTLNNETHVIATTREHITPAGEEYTTRMQIDDTTMFTPIDEILVWKQVALGERDFETTAILTNRTDNESMWQLFNDAEMRRNPNLRNMLIQTWAQETKKRRESLAGVMTGDVQTDQYESLGGQPELSRVRKAPLENTVSHPKSVFRPAYGTNFKYSGQVVHGVTNYLIAVAVRMPEVNWHFLENHWPIFQCDNNVTMFLRSPLAKERCRDMNLILMSNNHRASEVADTAKQIMYENIPRMLAREDAEEYIPARPGPLQVKGYSYPETDNSQLVDMSLHPRKYRGDGAPRAGKQVLAMAAKAVQMAPQVISISKQAYGIAKEGYKFFQKMRGWNLFSKLRDFVNRPSANARKIRSLEGSLAALAKQDARNFARVFGNLDNLRQVQDVLRSQFKMIELRESHLTISAKRLSMMESILSDVRMLQTGVQQLINGHLDPNILPPADFEKLMDYVKEDLRLYYPDYEPALPRIGQYYQVNIVKWTIENGTLMMIIPVMVRHRQEKPMDLFRLQIIPMPYFSNPKRPKEKDGRIAYTKLELEHDMLVMDEFRNAPYRSEDLADCVKLEQTYYCDDLHLVYVSNIPNCAASIYHNGDPELIARSCPFKYYHKMIPEPMILDGGDEILIAGSQSQWTMMCQDNEEVPRYLDAKPYVIIKREDLCQCKLVSGEFFLQENLSTCRKNWEMKKRGNILVMYTLNAAVAGGFSGNSTSLVKTIGGRLKYLTSAGGLVPVRGDMMSVNPYDLGITDVKIYDSDAERNQETLVDSYSATKEVPLEDVIYATVTDQELSMEETDVIIKKRKFNSWFKLNGSIMLGILFIMAAIGVFALILYGLTLQQWAGTKVRFLRLTKKIAEHTDKFGHLVKAGILPYAEAKGYESTVIFRFEFTTIMTLVIAQIAIVITLGMLWWIWKRFWKYISSDYTETPLSMIKRSWISQMFDTRNTELIMQISSANLGRSRQIYVTTIPGHPTLFSIEGRLLPSSVKRTFGFLKDKIIVPWNEVKLYVEDRMVILPEDVSTPRWARKSIRRLLAEVDCRIRFLLVHNHEYVVLQPRLSDIVLRPPPMFDGSSTTYDKRTAAYEPMGSDQTQVKNMLSDSIADMPPPPRMPLLTNFHKSKESLNAMPTFGGATSELYERFEPPACAKLMTGKGKYTVNKDNPETRAPLMMARRAKENARRQEEIEMQPMNYSS